MKAILIALDGKRYTTEVEPDVGAVVHVTNFGAKVRVFTYRRLHADAPVFEEAPVAYTDLSVT